MKEKKSNLIHNIQYGAIQAFYWMMFCSVIGYVSTYLLNSNFKNSQIGIVLAIANIIAVVFQPVIADIIDKYKRISIITTMSILLGIILLLSIILQVTSTTKWGLYLIITPIVTVVTILHPFVNSLSFLYEKKGISVNFGVCRGMGSISYAILSVIIGNVINNFSPALLPIFYIISIVGLISFIIWYGWSYNKSIIVDNTESNNKVKVKSKNLLQFIKSYKKFVLLLLGATFILFDHSLINNFFTQIVYNINGTDVQMGNAISLGAALELPIMLLFFKLKNKVNCGTLLKISGISFAVKHLITFLAGSMSMIYVAQILQIVGFGLFIPAAVFYVQQIMSDEDAVKGQSMITISITLGGVFASIVGGRLLDTYGASTMLLVGAIASIAGAIIMIFTADKVKYKEVK